MKPRDPREQGLEVPYGILTSFHCPVAALLAGPGGRPGWLNFLLKAFGLVFFLRKFFPTWLLLLHSPGKTVEAQRGELVCPRSHSKLVSFLGIWNCWFGGIVLVLENREFTTLCLPASSASSPRLLSGILLPGDLSSANWYSQHPSGQEGGGGVRAHARAG